MLRSRVLTGVVVAAFVGVLGLQIASCTLEQTGTQIIEVGAACEVDATCNAPPNDNPCRPGTCGTTKNCEYAVLDGVAAPNSVQKPAA